MNDNTIKFCTCGAPLEEGNSGTLCLKCINNLFGLPAPEPESDDERDHRETEPGQPGHVPMDPAKFQDDEEYLANPQRDEGPVGQSSTPSSHQVTVEESTYHLMAVNMDEFAEQHKDCDSTGCKVTGPPPLVRTDVNALTPPGGEPHLALSGIVEFLHTIYKFEMRAYHKAALADEESREAFHQLRAQMIQTIASLLTKIGEDGPGDPANFKIDDDELQKALAAWSSGKAPSGAKSVVDNALDAALKAAKEEARKRQEQEGEGD